jgi:transcriptional regulator with PAS, ATPase and Fis domain
MVAAASFRADLYYRLNVLPIRLPALRERLADLEALVEVAERRHRPPQRPARTQHRPEALALLAGRTGRATSASCATCWSRPR